MGTERGWLGSSCATIMELIEYWSRLAQFALQAYLDDQSSRNKEIFRLEPKPIAQGKNQLSLP